MVRRWVRTAIQRVGESRQSGGRVAGDRSGSSRSRSSEVFDRSVYSDCSSGWLYFKEGSVLLKSLVVTDVKTKQCLDITVVGFGLE